jgi:hypothetical protein
MPQRPIVIVVALLFAIGVPMVYGILKKRAAASLGVLLGERFVARLCPVAEVAVPSGGRVHCYQAYDDARKTGFVLVLGNWARGTIRIGAAPVSVDNRVAGLFKPGSDAAWLDRVRSHPDVIVATAIEGGALVIWKGLPSRDSVLAHFQTVSTGADKGLPSPSILSQPKTVSTGEVKTAPTSQTSLALNPRDAYFLAYLPSVVGKTVVNYALVDAVAAHAAGDAKLDHACKFSRQAIKVSEVEMHASYNSLVELAKAVERAPNNRNEPTDNRSAMEKAKKADVAGMRRCSADNGNSG